MRSITSPIHNYLIESVKWIEDIQEAEITEDYSGYAYEDLGLDEYRHSKSLDTEYRMYMAPILNLHKGKYFEECMSTLGVFFCRVARDLENLTNVSTSALHRELISRSFFQKCFDQFNNEVKRKGGKPLNINNFEIIHQKSAMYMEYFYSNGFYRKASGLIIIGDNKTWIDLKMDEQEALIFIKGFASILMLMIPEPVTKRIAYSLMATAVVEYINYQAQKNRKKRPLGALNLTKESFNNIFTSEYMELSQHPE